MEDLFMIIVLNAIFSMNTSLPFQILEVTITKIYHLWNILPISDYYLLLLNLFEVFQVLNSLNPNKCKGFDNLPNRILKICS